MMKRRVVLRGPWLVVGVLMVAVLGAAVWRALAARQVQQEALQTQQAQQQAPAVLELRAQDVAVAQVQELVQQLPISGALKAARSAYVKAQVSGVLQGLSVREGDRVQAGQVLAQVDPSEYQARMRQAQQQAESARGQLDIAQRSVDNNRALVEQGFISKNALDTSLANLVSAQGSYRAAQAGAEVLQKMLSDTLLRAPLAGEVSQRWVQNGERVAPEARVLEIVDLGSLELEAAISPADALGLAVGQSAQLTVEGASAPLRAKVLRINPSAQVGSRAVLAYLAVPPAAGLRQGLFAQGYLTLGRQRVLAVPALAVRSDKPQPYVQLLVDGAVVHRTVALGLRGEVQAQDKAQGHGEGQGPVNAQEMVQVLSGLAPGAQVLQGAVGLLREGTRVRTAVAQPAGQGAQ